MRLDIDRATWDAAVTAIPTITGQEVLRGVDDPAHETLARSYYEALRTAMRSLR